MELSIVQNIHSRVGRQSKVVLQWFIWAVWKCEDFIWADTMCIFWMPQQHIRDVDGTIRQSIKRNKKTNIQTGQRAPEVVRGSEFVEAITWLELSHLSFAGGRPGECAVIHGKPTGDAWWTCNETVATTANSRCRVQQGDYNPRKSNRLTFRCLLTNRGMIVYSQWRNEALYFSGKYRHDTIGSVLPVDV